MSNTYNGIFLTKPDGTLDEYGNNSRSGGSASDTNFVGTRAEWEALSSAQQNAYDTLDIDEGDTMQRSPNATITCDGTKSHTQILNELFSSIDINKVTDTSYLVRIYNNERLYFRLFTKTNSLIQYVESFVSSGIFGGDVIGIRASSSYWYESYYSSTQQFVTTDFGAVTSYSGQVFELYY